MTTRTASTKRKNQLAQIHIAKKELGLDDETYRALLWDVARVDSSSKLDDAGRALVLKRFRLKGWKNSSQRGAPKSANAEKAPLISKIGALLADMKLPWSYANGIAKQMYKVQRVDWCDTAQLRAIITALIKRRENNQQ